MEKHGGVAEFHGDCYGRGVFDGVEYLGILLEE